jgi:hypothetical protein
VIRIGGPAPRTTPKKPRRPRLRKQPAPPLSLEALTNLDLERCCGQWRATSADRPGLEELNRRSCITSSISEPRRVRDQRCCQPARWGLDACTLARKLANLPVLRAALASKALTWSMVELVAPHATPDTESGLALEASRSTVRRMRELLRKGDTKTASPDEDHAAVSITMSSSDAWLLEHEVALRAGGVADEFRPVRALAGRRGLMSLAEVVPAGELAEMHARDEEFRER